MGLIGEGYRADGYKAHGMLGSQEEADWPPLTLAEVDTVLRRYPVAGGARALISRSPRPFSAGSVAETALGGRLFVKRHALAVRDRAGLLEEHRFLGFLAGATWDGVPLVRGPLADQDGETVVVRGDWVYEVHPVARGVDVYEEALSWTPFLSVGHARAAGLALARLHLAAAGYEAPAREASQPRQLVSSYTIFAGGDPVEAMEAYLASRPLLRKYLEERDWRRGFAGLLLPYYRELEPWLGALRPLWTHNDFHASNLMWSGAEQKHASGAKAPNVVPAQMPGIDPRLILEQFAGGDEVTAIVDFGLADRTNAVHDLATAIERNVVEWLRMDDADIVRFDHLEALLAGYEEFAPMAYAERRALVAMLPLVHCEFALSETDYFLSVLHSEDKARLAYEGYFVGHAEWFRGEQGRGLLEYLRAWADGGKP